jgi:hypothetical protein
MGSTTKPTSQDALEAVQQLLSALVHESDVMKLTADLAPLHPRNNTFPGEVFLQLGADALQMAGVSRDRPIAYEELLGTFLPEGEFRGRENRKMKFALLATASLHGGVEPDLLDEVTWWQTDDFWEYALLAAVAYIRAAAAHDGTELPALCARLAEHQGVTL